MFIKYPELQSIPQIMFSSMMLHVLLASYNGYYRIMRNMENIMLFFCRPPLSLKERKSEKGERKRRIKRMTNPERSYVENPDRNPPKERVQKKR